MEDFCSCDGNLIDRMDRVACMGLCNLWRKAGDRGSELGSLDYAKQMIRRT